MRVPALIVLCAALSSSVVSAQSTGSVEWDSTSRGTGVISGHVTTVDAMPAAGAVVLLSTPGGKRRIIADEQGWFEFTDLAPADYQVSATMAGYLTRTYGQTLEDDRPTTIRMRKGRVRSNIDIVLPRSGVVIVQVTDESNAPVEGVRVRVGQVFVDKDGALTFDARPSKQRTFSTDDRGEIRVADLPPGEYFVSALMSTPDSTGQAVEAQIYYPGVSRLEDAQAVMLELGQDVTVGLSVVTPRTAEPAPRMGVVTVHVTDESGNPQEGVEVRALSVNGEGDAPALTRAATSATSWPDSDPAREFYTDGNGDARVYGLPAGQYVVVAQPLLSHIVAAKRGDRALVLPPIYYPGSPVAADAQPISISPWNEVNLDLRIAPVPAARISGKVLRVDGEPSRSTVVLRWDKSGPLYSDHLSTADVRVELVDGMFVFPTVHPGDYIIETDDGDLAEPEGYAALYIKVAHGVDIENVELTVVPRPPER